MYVYIYILVKLKIKYVIVSITSFRTFIFRQSRVKLKTVSNCNSQFWENQPYNYFLCWPMS